MFDEKDITRLEKAIQDIDQKRKERTKSTIELELSCCKAKIYHMSGEHSCNPIVRVDLRMGD